jgi:hypothetical protein
LPTPVPNPANFSNAISAGNSSGEAKSGDLDRDHPVQVRIARFVNVAHTTGANRRNNFVSAESIAGRKVHLYDQVKFGRSRRTELPDAAPIRKLS